MAMGPRWFVEVWTVPPKGGRYRDAHPHHRVKLAEMGMPDDIYCGTVEAIGRLVNRTYRTKAGAERAAARYRRIHPDTWVEISSGGVFG